MRKIQKKRSCRQNEETPARPSRSGIDYIEGMLDEKQKVGISQSGTIPYTPRLPRQRAGYYFARQVHADSASDKGGLRPDGQFDA